MEVNRFLGLLPTEGKLNGSVTVNYASERKYLVFSDNSTRQDFLKCSGRYTGGGGERGLQIHLEHWYINEVNECEDCCPSRQWDPMDMTRSAGCSHHFTFKCSDERLDNGQTADVSSGYCLFGITKMSKCFSGEYKCKIYSTDFSNQIYAARTYLQVYGKAFCSFFWCASHVNGLDKIILVNVSQFPSSGEVEENGPLSLTCNINHQSYPSSLSLQWRRNGRAVYNSSGLPRQTKPGILSYVYRVKKADFTKDAGLYACVIVNYKHGVVIDTLNAAAEVFVKCKLLSPWRNFLCILACA